MSAHHSQVNRLKLGVVDLYLQPWQRVNSLAGKKVPSAALKKIALESSNAPAVEQCFWMKLASYR